MQHVEVKTTTQLSKLDHRDVVLDRVIQQVHDFVATLPVTLSNTLRHVPVVDQKATSCCVSISLVHTLCKQWNRTDFNYYFINNYRNLLESLSDSGMSPREAYLFLYYYGCALKDTYPDDRVWINDGTVKSREIPRSVIEQSRQYRIKAFGTIHSPDVVIEVLRIGEKHPTLFGDVTITVPIFNDSLTFWRSSHNETAKYWHDVVVVGYDEERYSFKIQNSWGTDWGENGFTWMTKEDWLDVVVQAMFSTSDQALADVLHQHSTHKDMYLVRQVERLLHNVEALATLGPQPDMTYIRVEGENSNGNSMVKHPAFLVNRLAGNRLLQRIMNRRTR